MIKTKELADVKAAPKRPKAPEKTMPFLVRRVPVSIVAWIDAKAKAMDMSRNDYMLGLLDEVRARK